MITLLSRIFIKNRLDYRSPEVRNAYGTLCSVFGIFLNLLLFAAKLTAGLLSASVAMVADAVNNLSDAGSSVISLVGFKMSSKQADSDHPFGHGRMEYISGVIVSVIIILMGVELLKSSVSKIIDPQDAQASLAAIVVLALAVCAKLYMAFYNNKIGEKISSPSMKAVTFDSLSDSAATTVVLVSALISRYAEVNVDGWAGAAVSLFVLWAGVKALKETVAPLLGQPADRQLVESVEHIVMSHPVSHGIHDLVVHDYGVGRVMISLHVEVDGSGDIYELHDEIDLIEQELCSKLSCEAVIHMDPIAIGDARLEALKGQVGEILKDLDSRLSLHDFRMVPGPTHTNLIFDVVMPFDSGMSAAELTHKVCGAVRAMDGGRYSAVIKVDKSFVQ